MLESFTICQKFKNLFIIFTKTVSRVCFPLGNRDRGWLELVGGMSEKTFFYKSLTEKKESPDVTISPQHLNISQQHLKKYSFSVILFLSSSYF